MPTWEAISDHMRAKYRLQEDRADHASMVWSYDDGRTQKILIRRYTAFDREMLELKSAFAKRSDVDPEAMLRKNADLPLAMIALVEDVYCVVYNVIVEHLNLDDLDFYLSRVAAVADTLEENYARRDMF